MKLPVLLLEPNMKTLKLRAGITMVELLLFVGISGLMAGTVIPMLMSATESRQRQDALALAEQNGEQILQTITTQVRNAERIIYPSTGSSSIVLALQTDSGSTTPTIFGLSDGALIMIQGRNKRILSSPLVAVTSFGVDNTSTSDDRQSLAVTFAVERVIRFRQPLVYEAVFDTVINVFPDDELATNNCDCITPYCDTTGSGQYIWEACIDNTCIPFGAVLCESGD